MAGFVFAAVVNVGTERDEVTVRLSESQKQAIEVGDFSGDDNCAFLASAQNLLNGQYMRLTNGTSEQYVLTMDDCKRAITTIPRPDAS